MDIEELKPKISFHPTFLHRKCLEELSKLYPTIKGNSYTAKARRKRVQTGILELEKIIEYEMVAFLTRRDRSQPHCSLVPNYQVNKNGVCALYERCMVTGVWIKGKYADTYYPSRASSPYCQINTEEVKKEMASKKKGNKKKGVKREQATTPTPEPTPAATEEKKARQKAPSDEEFLAALVKAVAANENTPVSSGAIAKITGTKRGPVRAAMKRLIAEGKVEGITPAETEGRVKLLYKPKN